jgi:CheY-like chemotaxis protein
MRILIAEDDISLQSMVGRLMKRWGFDYDLAANGQDAVAQAQAYEGKYDLCLMDIDMPIMNGFEATKIIRRKLNYFPIMALTGNIQAKQEYLKVGMDDFLEKPYSFDNLYQKINELTVKYYRFEINGKDFFIKKEMPMDSEHNKELRELAQKGLCKMSLKGAGAHDVTFIVHKNVPFSISYDFIEEEAEVSTFLDRRKGRPAECYLYKSNCLVPAIYITDEEYEEKRQKEDKKFESRTELVTKKKEKR